MYCSSNLHFAQEQLDFGGTFGKKAQRNWFIYFQKEISTVSTNPANSIADFYSNVPPGCFKLIYPYSYTGVKQGLPGLDLPSN